MRYVVGARVLNNDGTIVEGLYVYGKYGLPYILTKDNYSEGSRLVIFETLKEINEYLDELRKAYYTEFHNRASRYNLNLKDFKFYALKYDSSKMKHIKTCGFVYSKDKTHKYHYFQVVNS